MVVHLSDLGKEDLVGPISVGAVGAAAPTDFQTDRFSTHRF